MHDYPDNNNTLNWPGGQGGPNQSYEDSGEPERGSGGLFTFYIVGVENIITQDIWLFLTKKLIFEKNARCIVIWKFSKEVKKKSFIYKKKQWQT